MDWYYAEGTKQVGPLDGRQMGLLAQQGKITPDTLVWREGLPSWVAAKKVAPNLFQGVPQQPAAPQPPPQKASSGATSSINLELTGDLGLKSNLADSLNDLGGASNLLGDLGDLSGLSGLGLGDVGGAAASPVVGKEFVCAACGTMKPSEEAVSFEGKVLCKQCGFNLGKAGGPAYAEGTKFYKEKVKRHPVKDFKAFYGRNSRQFMAAGIALGLLAMVVVLRLAGVVGIARYAEIAAGAAVVGVAYTGNGLGRAYGRTVFIAVILIFVGEMFMSPGSSLRLIGALAFLGAHAAFLIAFWMRGFSLGWSIGAAIPLLGITMASYFWLHQEASVELEIAMIGYGLVLTAMTVFGIATIGARATTAILIGAIAFYISDILFARALAFGLRGRLADTLLALPLRHIALILFAFSISTERERVGKLEAQALAAQPQNTPNDPLANL